MQTGLTGSYAYASYGHDFTTGFNDTTCRTCLKKDNIHPNTMGLTIGLDTTCFYLTVTFYKPLTGNSCKL